MTALASTLIAELGDKTQLIIITLCSKWSKPTVFKGSMMAFSLIDGLSILLGRALASLMPLRLISLISGLAFISIGLYDYLTSNGESLKTYSSRDSTMAAFTLVTLAELGDKTQLASIFLSAYFNHPLTVFLGVITALLAVTIVSVYLGSYVWKFFSKDSLKKISFTSFTLIGLILMLTPLILQ